MNGRIGYQLLWVGIIAGLWLSLIAGFLYLPYATRWLNALRPSISIFVWSDLIDAQIIREFEKQTGVRVYVNYYESNDELLTKLRFVHGGGYDLFIPSHYLMKTLIKDGLIKKIDKSRLEFWNDIDPRFLAFDYDPVNDYTIPYIWDVYGLGVDTAFFADKKNVFEPSWRMLFQPPIRYKVGMTNEPREVTSIVSMYLYGSLEKLTRKKRAEVARLLMSQKRFVEAYTDLTTDFLLTSNACPIVLAPNNAIARARRQNRSLAFILPREGTVMSLESIVIAAKSTKDDLVYSFINFLFKSEAMHRTCERYGDLPVLKRELQSLSLDYIDKQKLLGSYFKTIKLIASLMPRHELFAFWVALKAY